MDFLIEGFNPANQICPTSSCTCHGGGNYCNCHCQAETVCTCKTVNNSCTCQIKVPVCPTQCSINCSPISVGGKPAVNPIG